MSFCRIGRKFRRVVLVGAVLACGPWTRVGDHWLPLPAWLLYRLVPNAPVRWRDALIGAVLATIAQ